jgi:cyclopropane-fatty-acyl-phospholipid synthase
MYLNSDRPAETALFVPAAPSSSGVGPWLLRRVLRHLECGRLTVILPSGKRIDHSGPRPGPEATIIVHNNRALRRLLFAGDVGFAEGYIAGDWSSPNLVALIALAAENIGRLQKTMDGFLPIRLLNRLRHLLRRNSRTGSRRNIAFHYDLGNQFYRRWLDTSMTYSSACAIAPGETLEDAQKAKLDRIATLLELSGKERVLEIGCGWGALAGHLAPRCGGVTGITLSREQLAYARGRVNVQAYADRIDLRLQDYRDVQGKFDRIVSIEMLEAVGESYWPAYFTRLRECLAPGGVAVLQIITMREDRFETYRNGSDFIQRYIFPGGMLPTPGIVARQAAAAGLALASVEMFREGYADTLAEWRRRFENAWPEIARLGFDADFERLWTYYLSYCEAGFRTGTIDVGLYVLKA